MTAAATAHDPAGSGRPGPRTLLVVGVIAFALWRLPAAPAPAVYCPADRQPNPDAIVMLSTAWCPYCAQARRFFHREGIAFCEFDTERSVRGRTLFERNGAAGVPIFLTPEGVVHGFDEDVLARIATANRH